VGEREKNPDRNREPLTIDTSMTGTHATGNYLGPPDAGMAEVAERIRKTGLIWADQDDHAKEAMTREGSGPQTHHKSDTRP
jgi:hypothetical protein